MSREPERLEQLAAARLSDVDALAADRDAWAEHAPAVARYVEALERDEVPLVHGRIYGDV